MVISILVVAHLIAIGVSVAISVIVGIVQIEKASGEQKISLTDVFNKEVAKVKVDLNELKAKFESHKAAEVKPSAHIDVTIEKTDESTEVPSK